MGCKLVLLVVLLVALSTVSCADYTGHQVLHLHLESPAQLDSLRELASQHTAHASFWTDRLVIPGTIDVQVAPHVLPEFLAWASGASVDVSVLHEDLQRDIDHSFARNAEIRAAPDSSFFDTYADFDQMEAWLADLAHNNPNLVSRVQVGKTIEGRDITGVVISGGTRMNKTKVVINGCQHAREWISPMTVAYVAQTLVQNYTLDARVEALVNEFEWTIIPIVNGDGYVYTWTNDRMWRKNRRVNEGSRCDGVDINRNWNYEWGTDGTLPLTCADTYAGPSGFSEPEETAVANYIAKQGNVKAYIDFHSYGALFMFPWGWVCDQPTPDDQTQSVAARFYAQAAQSVNGVTFTVGPICDTIYPASGDSVDWAYGAAGVTYAFACELRGNSFILPDQEIIPSGKETFAGVVAWATYIKDQL